MAVVGLLVLGELVGKFVRAVVLLEDQWEASVIDQPKGTRNEDLRDGSGERTLHNVTVQK